ncbi:nascent polypeptide-associated complex protein [Candidatus Bipolaricaulota bacterium]|nr:nascent polypeptide-associated complex protein [Candidatus Bipolaricaulota bacterium]
MFPRKIDRRQMERAMRQMGVKMQELDGVREVVIKFSDREIVIPEAQVTLTEMAGQRSYQVVGREIERKLAPEIAEEDIKLVMEQAGVDRETASRALLETNGDIAEAILKLKGKT